MFAEGLAELSKTTKESLMVQMYSSINLKDKIIKVPSDDGLKIIGIIENGIFVKCNFQVSKHICFKYQAIGLDKKAFEQYIKPNAYLIVCQDKKNATYSITPNVFEANCIEDDLGWGSQLFCPVEFWSEEKSNCKQLSFWENEL